MKRNKDVLCVVLLNNETANRVNNIGVVEFDIDYSCSIQGEPSTEISNKLKVPIIRNAYKKLSINQKNSMIVKSIQTTGIHSSFDGR